jgi:hypothetical protein
MSPFHFRTFLFYKSASIHVYGSNNQELKPCVPVLLNDLSTPCQLAKAHEESISNTEQRRQRKRGKWKRRKRRNEADYLLCGMNRSEVSASFLVRHFLNRGYYSFHNPLITSEKISLVLSMLFTFSRTSC